MISRKLLCVVMLFLAFGAFGYGTKITIDNASGIWEKPFVYPMEVLSIASRVETRILAEYATTLFEVSIVYPNQLIEQTSTVPARIMVEYASSIATFDLVNDGLVASGYD